MAHADSADGADVTPAATKTDERARKAAQGRAAAAADVDARARGEERPIDLALRKDAADAPAYAVPAVAAPAVETTTEWYGWEIMLTDAASLTLLFAGAMLAGDGDAQLLASGAVAAGVGGLALAPAFVHLQHGNPGTAVASIGVRVGLPAAGMLAGYAASCIKDEDQEVACPLSLLFGVVGGSAAALIIDYALLSRSTVAVNPRRDARYGLGVAPRSEGGFTLSLGGSF